MEKALKRLEGVADAKTNLRQGVVHITWKKGVPFSEAKLKETVVTRGGYTYREAVLTADGVISRWQDQPALKVTGTEQIFLLVGDPSAPAGLEQLLKAAGSSPTRVELIGRVHSHVPGLAQTAPPGLMVRSFKLQ